jgi:predicted acetyltransferase
MSKSLPEAELVLPHTRYKRSFLEALREYQEEKLPKYIELNPDELEVHFDVYVRNLLAEAEGKGLPEGYVSHTEYWLVLGNEFIGMADIRHELSDFLLNVGGHIGYDIRPSKRRQGYGSLILKLGLQKAQELGLRNILVTCDLDNEGSRRIIEKNGGRLENILDRGPKMTKKRRYWIDL